MRKLLAVIVCGTLALIAGCGAGSGGGTTTVGGGGGTPPGSNVQAIAVDGGLPLTAAGFFVNGVFTTVTVCMPGTTTCQAIDHVLVDTGSVGLRLLDSAGGGEFSLALQPETISAGGSSIANCAQFLDGTFLWGPMELADVKMGSEVAPSVPVQIAGATAFATVPTSCSVGGTSDNTLAALGANGILGVGLFPQDCGPGCANAATPLPGFYYTCATPSTCAAANVPVLLQAQNPVTMFPVDNNGVIIELPAVPAAGSATVSGSMIFGIGTQSNNTLGTAKIFPSDLSGNFITSFGTNTNIQSFIDSGSNGLFFLDSVTTGIPLCSGTSQAPGFYCPTATQSLTATQKGATGTTTNAVSFSIANANSLIAGNPNGAAFSNLGAPAGATLFDWGLPFFYGKNVFVAIEGTTNPGGAGPFWAY